MMSTWLQDALGFAKAGADYLFAKGETQLPTLTASALAELENVVAPQLDVPSEIVALAKGENPTIEASVDPFLASKLKLLQARVDSVIISIGAPLPAAAAAAKPAGVSTASAQSAAAAAAKPAPRPV